MPLFAASEEVSCGKEEFSDREEVLDVDSLAKPEDACVEEAGCDEGLEEDSCDELAEADEGDVPESELWEVLAKLVPFP